MAILRKSREVLKRYAGKERHDFPIPLDGVSLESLTEKVYSIMGGRLPDVLRFVQRVEATRKSPLEVLLAMQQEAESEILNRAFGKKLFKVESPGNWTQTQAWKCIHAIVRDASENSVPMRSVLLSVFKGDQKALDDLISTGVLRVVETKDRELYLAAGSPMYLHQFRLMVNNPTMYKGFQQACLDEEYKKYNEEAATLEDDLAKIGKTLTTEMIGGQGRQGVARRKEQLAQRLGELTDLIIKNRQAKSRL